MSFLNIFGVYKSNKHIDEQRSRSHHLWVSPNETWRVLKQIDTRKLFNLQLWSCVTLRLSNPALSHNKRTAWALFLFFYFSSILCTPLMLKNALGLRFFLCTRYSQRAGCRFAFTSSARWPILILLLSLLN